jgi:hypothetical protein
VGGLEWLGVVGKRGGVMGSVPSCPTRSGKVAEKVAARMVVGEW